MIVPGDADYDAARTLHNAMIDKRPAVIAQPGLTWGEFDRETQHFGLATTGGAASATGIAGLTLGGGLGWLPMLYPGATSPSSPTA